MTAAIDPSTTTVGVVGAGNMGSGIAQKYATEGFRVVVVDMNDEAAAKGQERVTSTLDEGVKRKIFKPEQRDAVLGRMTFTADKGALQDAALVVEAIFEDKGVKQALFKELDEICSDETILATNTSSFFVDDVAEACSKPERVVGLHYFYHPAKNRLVEVIKGSKTSQGAYDRAWALQERSAKTPIASKDAPGFIVNRFFVPWLNEALRIVDEGEANIATVEAAAKKSFGVGMGPFELMNVTGVPITLHAATTLGEQLGAFYAPCDLIRPQVEKKENWDLTGDIDESKVDAVADRLWGVTIQVATRLVFDESVCTLEDCDLGARVGLRWPQGPFEAMNARGLDWALLCVEKIAARYDDVEVPKALAAQAKEGPWDIAWVTSRVDDGVGTITICRPDAMNALSADVMKQLAERFDALVGDDAVKGIVFAGQGKAFVAGADIRWFMKKIEADKVDDVVAFATEGQATLRRIDTCDKPTVCRLHGLSLGGGSELALACDWVVATESGSLGFPETGIGIYPGFGGTQRATRRSGVALGRWMVLTGETIPAKRGLALGLVDEVVSASELDEACRKRALSGQTRPETAPPTSVPDGYEALAQVFEAPLGKLLDGAVDVPEGDAAAPVAKALKRLSHKAPLALTKADELVRMCADHTQEEGLAAESEGLHAMFSSADALEGMRSLGRGRPTFRGR